MAKKRNEEKDLEIEKEVYELSFGYIFLLIAFVIFFVSLHSFDFYILDTKTNFSIFILPFMFFMEDAILKEVGYKQGVLALVLSAVALFITSVGVDYIFNIDFDIMKHFGLMLAYIISQFINMTIYYYMLDNYRTPFVFVALNFIFSILLYNMFYMLFSLGFIFTPEFWLSYGVIAIIESLIAIICTILLALVRQGVDTIE